MPTRKNPVLAVVTGAAVIVALGATTAIAAGHIGSKQIADDSIRSRDVHNGTLKFKDLNTKLKTAIRTPASDTLGGLVGQYSSASATPIALIGGSFKTNATVLGQVKLPAAGTYQINAYGFFDTVAADSVRTDATRLMLAVRDKGAGDFGEDFGTCFTGTFPAAPNDREATCQAVRVIKVNAPTTLYVKAFGYNDDQSGTGAGSFTVKADVSAVKVG